VHDDHEAGGAGLPYRLRADTADHFVVLDFEEWQLIATAFGGTPQLFAADANETVVRRLLQRGVLEQVERRAAERAPAPPPAAALDPVDERWTAEPAAADPPEERWSPAPATNLASEPWQPDPAAAPNPVSEPWRPDPVASPEPAGQHWTQAQVPAAEPADERWTPEPAAAPDPADERWPQEPTAAGQHWTQEPAADGERWTQAPDTEERAVPPRATSEPAPGTTTEEDRRRALEDLLRILSR
jgi:hypothetical protein